jgi:hypothetical protein
MYIVGKWGERPHIVRLLPLIEVPVRAVARAEDD